MRALVVLSRIGARLTNRDAPSASRQSGWRPRRGSTAQNAAQTETLRGRRSAPTAHRMTVSVLVTIGARP